MPNGNLRNLEIIFFPNKIWRHLFHWKKRKKARDFPGGTVVKNLPANAGDTGSIPGGKIPHAPEQLSLCATTTEPAL